MERMGEGRAEQERLMYEVFWFACKPNRKPCFDGVSFGGSDGGVPFDKSRGKFTKLQAGKERNKKKKKDN